MTYAILIAGSLLCGFIIGWTACVYCDEAQRRRERAEWFRGRS